MKNLTFSQESILNKLLPKLEKTEPHAELLRVCLLFRDIKEIEEDGFLFERFKTIINNKLWFYLKSKEELYDLDRFKNIYITLVKDFINEHLDANEKDFIDEYINSQQEIIDKTFRYFIPVKGYEALELTQFVDKDFFDDFIRSSKKKIEYLNSQCIAKENATEINSDNTDRVKEEKEKKRITIRNKKIFTVLKQLNLKIEFLREDCTPEDFVAALRGTSEKEMHLNISNRNFHYLLSKIKKYFFNFSFTAVADTNKIYSVGGTLLKAKNLRNSKVSYPSLENEIDSVLINFDK